MSITEKLFAFPDSRMGESVAGNTLHQAAKSTSRRLARELLSSPIMSTEQEHMYVPSTGRLEQKPKKS